MPCLLMLAAAGLVWIGIRLVFNRHEHPTWPRWLSIMLLGVGAFMLLLANALIHAAVAELFRIIGEYI